MTQNKTFRFEERVRDMKKLEEMSATLHATDPSKFERLTTFLLVKFMDGVYMMTKKFR